MEVYLWLVKAQCASCSLDFTWRCVTICGHFYVSRGHEKVKEAVYKKIINGSRPELLYGDIVIPRKDDELLQWFV